MCIPIITLIVMYSFIPSAVVRCHFESVVLVGYCMNCRPLQHSNINLPWNNDKGTTGGMTIDSPFNTKLPAPGFSVSLQWGAADAEIKVPSGENTELSLSVVPLHAHRVTVLWPVFCVQFPCVYAHGLCTQVCQSSVDGKDPDCRQLCRLRNRHHSASRHTKIQL